MIVGFNNSHFYYQFSCSTVNDGIMAHARVTAHCLLGIKFVYLFSTLLYMANHIPFFLNNPNLTTLGSNPVIYGTIDIVCEANDYTYS